MPKTRPLKALLAKPLTLAKLKPLIMLALALPLALPTKLTVVPFTVVAVAEALVLVAVKL